MTLNFGLRDACSETIQLLQMRGVVLTLEMPYFPTLIVKHIHLVPYVAQLLQDVFFKMVLPLDLDADQIAEKLCLTA